MSKLKDVRKLRFHSRRKMTIEKKNGNLRKFVFSEMPRNCYPLCAEKRDFMEHNPAQNGTDFYREYDPMVGIGTAAVLALFFFTITINGCIRCAVRKYKMHKFYKEIRKAENNQKPICDTV
ncbi:hypothetical protein CRE_25481 [Caenorhabditis remanei]|uniref:Uncharacterized protein n=2 Tax=Caenorhabditis remanei TaxID=31234 RepID=E3LRU1_CAERE|nr:hypothetical protein CRE_25481 [Caenorhabditis remanei]